PTVPPGAPARLACAAKADTTPRTRFEPERLCTGGIPAASSRSATMRDVVVLPFVPATITTPCSSRLVSLCNRPGSTRSATSPGAEVPPPRPATRMPAAVVFATSSAADRRRSIPNPFALVVIWHYHPNRMQAFEVDRGAHLI